MKYMYECNSELKILIDWKENSFRWLVICHGKQMFDI